MPTSESSVAEAAPRAILQLTNSEKQLILETAKELVRVIPLFFQPLSLILPNDLPVLTRWPRLTAHNRFPTRNEALRQSMLRYYRRAAPRLMAIRTPDRIGTARPRGDRRPRQNFETWSWFFMRVSGLVLIFLALTHFAITHIASTTKSNNIAWPSFSSSSPSIC